jgi:hypothetical protein
MDPHRLARFLEGETGETERADPVRTGRIAPDPLDVFADAAAGLRENEQMRPASFPDEQTR